MKTIFLFTVLSFFLFSGCGNSHSGKTKEIIIFHAGSLSVPFKQLKSLYEKKNPGIEILLEPAGSLVCARKITELKKPCDILASADYFVINELLIPDYTKWSIRFATNEIVIAYHEKSRYSSEINSTNWIDILMKDDVIYSRSDPDSDPCGYRTVLTFMLAERYYNKEGLTEKMTSKNIDFIRPKETDLIALIESNSIDYMFQYKSVAIQHRLKYIELPDEINLSDPSKEEIYRTVSLDVIGSKPGTKMKVTGDYINYSMTVPDNAPDKDEAVDFICYMLSEEGMEIFKKNGQDPIIPVLIDGLDKLPLKLLKKLSGIEPN
ncbi:MAG: tungstate ABC transporter substrate-binding protein WtpA [Bacteroidales bacterium]|nr:tungstate ABC transporter substrate-binding protein WtpA [Bacteroidales bacterium]